MLLCATAMGLFSVVASASDFGYGAIAVANDVKVIKTGLLGQKICFNDADFKSALALADFESITVTEIPSSTDGTLLIGGRRVGAGRVIKEKNLGALVFVPKSEETTEATFKFKVNGYAGNAEIECVMKFIDKVNYAPEAEASVTVRTQEEISVFSTLSASDPEGDSISYIIVSYPKDGVLTVMDNGEYCYSPNEGYKGRDSFTFVARDEYGNYSEPMKINLKVEQRMCDTVYADMTERAEYNAAVAMTAIGVMNGRILGDDKYFMPDETVSRAEFVALAMKAMGVRRDSTLQYTYFDDDQSIPTALKGYVATAARLGYIDGDFADGKLMFSPNEAITGYEAARIMARIIGADSEGEESVFAGDDSIPVWARASVGAMRSLGVISDDVVLTERVTRASAAEYLYRLIDVK